MISKTDIDLKDTQADSFYLISQAKELSKKTGKDSSRIIREMMSSDYHNLVQVFKREFKDFIR
jgi:transposase